MNGELKPWDRQPGIDTPKRYRAFCIFRDMGVDRTLPKVAEILKNIAPPTRPAKGKAGKKNKGKVARATNLRHTGNIPRYSTLKEWSMKYNWVARCEAWDAEQERLTRIEQDKARREMVARHVNIALTLQKKAAERLKQINPELNPDDLTAEQTLKYMEAGVKLERLTRGEPDQVIKHEGELKTEVTHGISEQILNDPEAADLACKLFERLAVGKSDARRTGKAGERSEMGTG